MRATSLYVCSLCLPFDDMQAQGAGSGQGPAPQQGKGDARLSTVGSVMRAEPEAKVVKQAVRFACFLHSRSCGRIASVLASNAVGP